VKDGFALIGATGYRGVVDDQEFPSPYEGNTFLYSRISNFAKWSLRQIFVSSSYSDRTRVLNGTHRLSGNNEIDSTALDLFGGSVVLFDGPSNTQSTVAIGAELGFDSTLRSGVVYLQNIAKLSYVYKQNPDESGPGNGLSGNNEEPTANYHLSMGVFIGLICGIVVPTTLAAAVLIYRFRSQSVVNTYEKASVHQPVLEEFELSDIIDPEQQLASKTKS
jgi:hypothetical protein